MRRRKKGPTKSVTIDLIKKDEQGITWYNTGWVWPSKHKKSDVLKEEVWIEENNIILKPNKEYILIIDYPVKNPFEYKFKTDSEGMSLKEVVNLAVKKYKQMYKEESKTSSIEAKRRIEVNKKKRTPIPARIPP